MERGERKYIVTTIYYDGLVVLTPIPNGMTEGDYGRRFHAAQVEVSTRLRDRAVES